MHVFWCSIIERNRKSNNTYMVLHNESYYSNFLCVFFLFVPFYSISTFSTNLCVPHMNASISIIIIYKIIDFFSLFVKMFFFRFLELYLISMKHWLTENLLSLWYDTQSISEYVKLMKQKKNYTTTSEKSKMLQCLLLLIASNHHQMEKLISVHIWHCVIITSLTLNEYF